MGSGPASGYTAAIYASRANMFPVYTKNTTWWTINYNNEVENWPGNPEGITGPEMMINFTRDKPNVRNRCA
jgi:thioredoxin reductase (NADPH)